MILLRLVCRVWLGIQTSRALIPLQDFERSSNNSSEREGDIYAEMKLMAVY